MKAKVKVIIMQVLVPSKHLITFKKMVISLMLSNKNYNR